MPVICRLPGGSQGSDSGSSDLQLNIFTQPDEPETKDGIWVQKANSHKKIVVDNLISTSGEWSDKSTTPFTFDAYSRPVLLGDKIIAFDSANNLWSFDGTTWTKIGDNSSGGFGQLCVLNNTLYAICDSFSLDSTGSNFGHALIKWTGSTWVRAGTLPSSDTDMPEPESCVVYNNYIYMLSLSYNSSTGTNQTKLLRSNGSTFSTVATYNYTVYAKGNGVAFNSNIYWLGNYTNNSSVDITCCMLTSNGSSITFPSTNNTVFGSVDTFWYPEVFDSIIHLLSYPASGGYGHYTFDGSTWTKMFDMGSVSSMDLCVYNTRLYAMGGNTIMYYSKTHEKYDPHTLILQIADTHDGPYTTALVKTSDIIPNSRFITNFDDVFFVGESGLETTDPIYYGDGSKWVKFKN